MEPFERLADLDLHRCVLWQDAPSGLRAIVAIDDVTLGPAAGGVRTKRYGSFREALEDAARLARAMTLKCALAGLDAGGAKAVVLDHPGLDRRAAFEVLGARVEELGGLFRTAGDLGTTERDLEAMARHTRFVHTGSDRLGDAVARGVLACVRACVRARDGREGLDGLAVAVQGCGVVGAPCARRLAAAGAALQLCDVDEARARQLAAELDARVLPAESFWQADVDLLAPCAVGGVLDEDAARAIRAWAVCGAANNLLAAPQVAAVLAERGVLLVPDVVASAGAVVDGIARTVMGLEDPAPLVEGLGDTAERVLERAREGGRPSPEVARELAEARLAHAGRI